MFVLWRVRNKDADRLAGDLNQARMLLEQREHERDLAQEELFRRLYEERELNKRRRRNFNRSSPSMRSTQPWPSSL